MAWFKFSRNFDWSIVKPDTPGGRGTVAYKASDRAIEVPEEVAEAAEAAGAGSRMKKAPKVTAAKIKDANA